MDFIYPYIKSTQVFVCPSATAYKSPPTPSYGYNNAFSGNYAYQPNYGGTTGSISTTQISRSSEVVMVMDYNEPSAIYANAYDALRWAVSANPAVQGRVIPHLEGGNICYADGHVKWMEHSRYPATATSSVTSTCNINNPNKAWPFCDRAWNPFIQ
jgi:prepilin-type processing-associated H-X9-DG protein